MFIDQCQSILENSSLSDKEKVIHLHFLLTKKWWELPPFPEYNAVACMRWLPRRKWINEDKQTILHNDTIYTQLQAIESYEKMIDPLLCIGSTWLYRYFRKEDRPLPDRLANIMVGNPEDITAVPVDIAGDFYRWKDGNHRIYAAYLLNRKVKIDCIYEYKVAVPADESTKDIFRPFSNNP